MRDTRAQPHNVKQGPFVGIARVPFCKPGLRIGLFGGSFNPPHEGHALAAAVAMRRLNLDRLWIVVSPGNPLKDHTGLPDWPTRATAIRQLMRRPRIDIVGLEAEIGARYTYETIAYLTRRYRGVRFVWIMGADNLTQFFRWKRWDDIARQVPIAVIDRPGSTHRSIHSKAAAWLAPYRLPESKAKALPTRRPPAFVMLHGPRSAQSSTALRAAAELTKRAWVKKGD